MNYIDYCPASQDDHEKITRNISRLFVRKNSNFIIAHADFSPYSILLNFSARRCH